MSLSQCIHGLSGGSLIGLSAATLLLGNGDILGFSGIFSSVLLKPRETMNSKNKWKLIFLSSFIVTSNIISRSFDESITPSASEIERLTSTNGIPIVSDLGYAVAGFLVGFGTRLGNGCTSGHGICGLARLSKRSFAAVLSFMATGIVTGSTLPKTGNILRSTVVDETSFAPTEITQTIASAAAALLPVLVLLQLRFHRRNSPINGNDEKNQERNQEEIGERKTVVASLSAVMFSIGLAISGMVKSHKIFGFLDMTGFGRGAWDGTLVFVMGGGLLVSGLSYQWVKGYNFFKNENALSCPLNIDKSCGKFNIPTKTELDTMLILGASIFGIGWGIGGLCPGPALFVAAAGVRKVILFWWPSNILGAFLAEQAKKLF